MSSLADRNWQSVVRSGGEEQLQAEASMPWSTVLGLDLTLRPEGLSYGFPRNIEVCFRVSVVTAQSGSLARRRLHEASWVGP